MDLRGSLRDMTATMLTVSLRSVQSYPVLVLHIGSRSHLSNRFQSKAQIKISQLLVNTACDEISHLSPNTSPLQHISHWSWHNFLLYCNPSLSSFLSLLTTFMTPSCHNCVVVAIVAAAYLSPFPVVVLCPTSNDHPPATNATS